MSQPTSSSYVDSLEQLKSLKKPINGLSLVLSTTKSNPSNYTVSTTEMITFVMNTRFT